MRGDPQGLSSISIRRFDTSSLQLNQCWLHYRLLDNWGLQNTRQDMA
jgi:hypothetical protein